MHARRRAATLGALLALGSLLGCSTMTSPSNPVAANGVVRYQTFEGGFYSIESDDGRHFDPTNLATEFRQDGLKVRFSGRIRTDMMNVHMYGEVIELTDIVVR